MVKTMTAAAIAVEGYMTREEAIQALVAHDVARWGEGERDAARRMHGKLSHGLAVNAMGARLALSDDPAEVAEGERIMREAKAILTLADKRELRKGG